MPNTNYASADYSSYQISEKINPAFDDILWKIMYVNFDMYGVQTLPSEPSTPVELNLLIETGNYKIEYYVDGPDGIKLAPIFISVAVENGVTYQFIHYMLDVHYRYGEVNEGGVCNWNDWTTAFNSKCPIYTGPIMPDSISTSYALWIDTSVPDFPVIRGYKEGLGWFGVGSLIDVMYAKTYDTENKFRDIFLYFEEKVGIIKFNLDGTYTILDENYERVTSYNLRAKYFKHLDLGHMSIEEREYFESTITKDDFTELYNQVKADFIAYADERIAGKVPSLVAAIAAEEAELMDHRKTDYTHIDPYMSSYWSKKSDPDHTHYNDYNVRIDASDIVSGIIHPDRLPSTLVERLVKVRTHKDRFALTTFDVQNGDSVYVYEETDEFEAGYYLVTNMYKLDKAESYIHYRTERLANIDFEDIGKKPTTYEGYGIKNAAPAIKDTEQNTPNTEYSEFVYPHNEDDGTFNYMLYKRVNDFVYNFEKVLWHIGDMIHNHDIQPMYVFIEWNKQSNIDLTERWTPYATIEGNQIPEQHTINETTHDSVEVAYDKLYALLY